MKLAKVECSMNSHFFKKTKVLIKLTMVLFILIFSGNAIALPEGNSAWVYGKKLDWIEQIKRFNSTVLPSHRINYLFPNTASVHVNQKSEKLIITYDKSVTQYYKHALKNIHMLPDLSFWVAKTNFTQWSKKNYELAADQITSIINNDQNADGVFLDLETYHQNMLPFYQELSKDLKKSNKMLSVIVSPGQENLRWFKSLGKNAFVVLYGYDLHQSGDSVLPVPPNEYRKRLEVAVNNIVKVAHACNIPVMIGIPAIATTREWHKRIDLNHPNKIITNPYHQIDYFIEALKVCQNLSSSRLYLGFSLWAFVKDVKNQQFFPLIISPAEWNLLYNYASGMKKL